MFLQDLLVSTNNKYGFFNSARSALSLIFLGDLGNDSRLKRFMKGISNIRPANPRYNFTWDPHVLLEKMESDRVPLSLFDLSKKLITLLALTTGHRIQTFSVINITDIVNVHSGFQIRISAKIKTSGSGKFQPCLEIPYFPQKPKLCVATTLKDYLQMTENIRGSINQLFLTSKKPIRAASKDTLSRWVKIAMTEAGIDINIFKPHSTRHATTSLAFRQGLSMDIIRRTAGWTEKSVVFAKFYNRPLATSTDFAKNIIMGSNNNYEM